MRKGSKVNQEIVWKRNIPRADYQMKAFQEIVEN